MKELCYIPKCFSLLRTNIEVDVTPKGDGVFLYDGHFFRMPLESLEDVVMHLYAYENKRLICAIYKGSFVVHMSCYSVEL